MLLKLKDWKLEKNAKEVLFVSLHQLWMGYMSERLEEYNYAKPRVAPSRKDGHSQPYLDDGVLQLGIENGTCVELLPRKGGFGSKLLTHPTSPFPSTFIIQPSFPSYRSSYLLGPLGMVPQIECEKRGALREQREVDAEECYAKGGFLLLIYPLDFTQLRTTGYIARISRTFRGTRCWAGRRSRRGPSDDDE
ncbi:hypothetical protein PAXINDRAFT_103341 [Paxillus involutus ATCC 200175]|uniref:Uncharacterized protein n=1 Tax=Paxillus involutus ATCC 200175 TaxID=664439 RepID=A0A0C9SV79_PAXIN|nr:hypothetical protein PAXINDRAFT_103341 [Paxillus involutus ATCC 200175]